MQKTVLALSASCAVITGVAAAQPAESDPRDQRIQELEARLEALTERVESLTADAAAEPIRVALPNGRPAVQTAEGDFRFAVRSLVQFDAAAYEQGSGATPDLNSGTNFRRARLGVEGVVYEDWNYELTFEFGGSGQEEAGKVLAAWVEYAGFDAMRVRVGAMAPSVGLDDAMSSGDLIFLERGAAAEMARGIAAGDGRSAIALIGAGERWFASAALTGGVAANGATFDEQGAFVGRIAGLAINNDHLALHVGANYSNVLQLPDVTAGAGAEWAQLRERPELRVDGSRLVDTGSLTADGITVTGIEAGVQAGRLLITAEAMEFTVDRPGGLPDAEFSGWHAQAVWSLTGEERAWKHKSGSFASGAPAHAFDPAAGQWGAWEIAARYSVLDLNDNEATAGAANTLGAPNAIVRGGEQTIATYGLNWRPNGAVRVMLNYQQTDIDRLDAAGAVEIGQSIDAVSLRTQLAF